MAGFYANVARYYDAENTDKNDDIPFYLELARASRRRRLQDRGRTGRVMFPLARAGYDVYGIDNEPAMLDRARALLKQEPALKSKLRGPMAAQARRERLSFHDMPRRLAAEIFDEGGRQIDRFDQRVAGRAACRIR